MSNGSDWQQGSRGDSGGEAGGGRDGGPRPPSGGGGGDGASPPGEGPPSDLLFEGWGHGHEVTLDEVTERLKLVFDRAAGSVLFGWLGLAAVLLAFSLIGSFFAILAELTAGGVETFFGVLGAMVGFLEWPIYYVVAAAQLALFSPLHREIFEGKGAAGDVRSVMADVKGIFWYMLAAVVLLSLATTLGGFCCIIPGLFVAFVFCQAPYLTATRRMDPIDAFKESFFLNKSYWMVILAMFVALFGVMVVASVLMGGAELVISLVSGRAATFLMPVQVVFWWLGFQVLVFGAFLVHASVFSVIETKETAGMSV